MRFIRFKYQLLLMLVPMVGLGRFFSPLRRIEYFAHRGRRQPARNQNDSPRDERSGAFAGRDAVPWRVKVTDGTVK